MASLPHPQLADIARMLRERGLSPADPLRTPLDEARAAARRYQTVWNEDPPPVARIDTVTLAVDGREVPLRITVPGPRLHGLPVLLYFHGGGFALNGLDTHDRLMRLLALGSGAAVVGVGYGLAPEHRFPSQLEDALAALDWVYAEGFRHGLDATRLAFGGDSAGANLALALQLALRDRGEALPKLGLLFYGMFSADLETPSHRAFGGGAHGLTTERVDWFWTQYLADHAQRDNPLAAPLHADLRGLPPQLVIGAGLDCLLDDSVTLAHRLGKAGVEHRLAIFDGVPHSFMQMSGHFEPARRAVAEATAAVAGAFRVRGKVAA